MNLKTSLLQMHTFNENVSHTNIKAVAKKAQYQPLTNRKNSKMANSDINTCLSMRKSTTVRFEELRGYLTRDQFMRILLDDFESKQNGK